MPGYDGTGPQGSGMLTGKGMGFCVAKISDDKDLDQKNKNEEVNMPGGDGTGPMGMGSMTGRGAGYCAGNNQPGFAHPAGGRGGMGYGRGCGRGLGRGRGRFFAGLGRALGWRSAVPYEASSKEDQAAILKDRVNIMQDEINVLNERIKALDSQSGKASE